MSWQFKCDGNTLCFNGGNCTISPTSGLSFCVCPDGFGADFELFHFPNCAKPINSTRDFFIFLAISSLASLLFYFTVIHPKLQRLARKIGFLSSLCIFCAFCVYLCVYLQDGCYEGCSIFSALMYSNVAWVLKEIIVVALKPIYAFGKRSITHIYTFLNGWLFINVVGYCSLGVGMAVTCRDENAYAQFNVLVILSTSLLNVLIMVDSIVMIASVNGMQGMLKDSLAMRSDPQIHSLLDRSNKLKLGGVLAPQFLLLLVGTPVIISLVGSFPYFFIVYDFNLAVTVYGMATLVWGFVHKRTSGAGATTGDVVPKGSRELSSSLKAKEKGEKKESESISKQAMSKTVVVAADGGGAE